MRRSLVPALLLAIAAVAAPQVASAAEPIGACPAAPSSFALADVGQVFADYQAAGGQQSREAVQAFFTKTDKNGDGFTCARGLPETPGNPAAATILIDNNRKV